MITPDYNNHLSICGSLALNLTTTSHTAANSELGEYESDAGVSADQCGSRFTSAAKLAVARIGKRPKDDTGVFINRTPKIHGEGENKHKEEEIDAKQ